MPDSSISNDTADAINDRMVQQMERRRRQQPERRQRVELTTPDRRALCGYCYQHGDHPTPVHCLRALERQAL